MLEGPEQPWPCGWVCSVLGTGPPGASCRGCCTGHALCSRSPRCAGLCSTSTIFSSRTGSWSLVETSQRQGPADGGSDGGESRPQGCGWSTSIMALRSSGVLRKGGFEGPGVAGLHLKALSLLIAVLIESKVPLQRSAFTWCCYSKAGFEIPRTA